MKIFNSLYKVLFLITVVFLIVFAIKGSADFKYFTNTHSTKVTGPFEASNSTSRYALTESIVDTRKFDFSEDLAKFSSPDVVSYGSKFFTVFTPGVSLFGVPFYAIGKQFGLQQPFTYLSTTIITLLNLLLLYKIARKLKVSTYAALLSAFVFTFATNAYVYMQSFTQHPLTVFTLLLLFLNLLHKRTPLNNFIFGLVAAFSLLVDIPNAFLVFPMAIVWIGNSVDLIQIPKKLRISINTRTLFAVFGLIIPLLVFGFYNKDLTGSPLKIAQFIGRNENITNTELNRPQEEAPSSSYEIDLPFDTRHSLNGFYILIASNERGIFYYSPVLLFGLLGLFIAFKNERLQKYALIAISIIGVNLLSYSMFGDPWGGWSFGPRYLIPATALLCLFIGVALDRYKKNIFILLAFLSLSLYSVCVSTLGTITTSSIPPKQEAENLITPIPYTYIYNWNLLKANISGSYVFNSALYKNVSTLQFYYMLSALSFSSILVGVILLQFSKNK